MKNMVVKLGVFLVTTASAWADVTKGERSPGNILDPKENEIHNVEFPKKTEDEMDFYYLNLTSKQHNGGRNGFCDLNGYNPCENTGRDEYHEHPSVCHYYIRCESSFPWCMDCGSTRHWDQKKGGCIHEAESKCEDGAKPTTEEPKPPNKCTANKKCSKKGGVCQSKSSTCDGKKKRGCSRKAGCVCCIAECGEIITNPIIGGADGPLPRKYPWTVEITINPKGVFTGSVINDRWILTGAKTVTDTNCNTHPEYEPSSVKIVVGGYDPPLIDDVYQGVTIKRAYNVIRIVRHGKYNCDTSDKCNTCEFDAALLKLDSSIVFNEFIRPICLPKKDDSIVYATQSAIGIGWWRVADKHNCCEVELTIRANHDCGLYPNEVPYGSNNDTTPRLKPIKLCAAPTEAVTNRDHGGPLSVLDTNTNKHILVGIYSYSKFGGSDINYPPVFTRVSKILKWIKCVLQKKPKNVEKYCYN